MHFSRRYLSTLLFAAALACGAAWQSAPALAQVTPQNVVIEGSTHTDAATIRSYFTGTDQASVNRAVADLSATGMFSKVSAKIVDGQVIVTVAESSQIINRVAFEGNNTLKSDQLAVEVQEKGHTGFDAAKADADVAAHQRRLQEDRPRRGPGQLPAGAASQRPRRRRLHDRRGRQDRHARNQVRRQPCRLQLSPAFADADDAR